jgi:hypothetical protein
MNKNLKVGIEDINFVSVDFICLDNAESGIDNNVVIINIMMVIVPQKNEIKMASFLRISCWSVSFPMRCRSPSVLLFLVKFSE